MPTLDIHVRKHITQQIWKAYETMPFVHVKHRYSHYDTTFTYDTYVVNSRLLEFSSYMCDVCCYACPECTEHTFPHGRCFLP